MQITRGTRLVLVGTYILMCLDQLVIYNACEENIVLKKKQEKHCGIKAKFLSLHIFWSSAARLVLIPGKKLYGKGILLPFNGAIFLFSCVCEFLCLHSFEGEKGKRDS